MVGFRFSVGHVHYIQTQRRRSASDAAIRIAGGHKTSRPRATSLPQGILPRLTHAVHAGRVPLHFTFRSLQALHAAGTGVLLLVSLSLPRASSASLSSEGCETADAAVEFVSDIMTASPGCRRDHRLGVHPELLRNISSKPRMCVSPPKP